jgi:hypothetical protein
MKKLFYRGMVIGAGLLTFHSAMSLSQQFNPPTYASDPRLLKLKNFFEERESPLTRLSRDFLIAADRHGLDWRLLPSISIVESGGGKAYRNNNIFGWDSCQTHFVSIRAGIHLVASRLSSSNLYKNKSLDEKLKTYNPDTNYRYLVKAVMARLGPSDLCASSNGQL